MRKIKTLEKDLEAEAGIIRLKMCLGEENGFTDCGILKFFPKQMIIFQL